MRPKDHVLPVLQKLRRKINKEQKTAVGAYADGLCSALEAIDDEIARWKKVPDPAG